MFTKYIIILSALFLLSACSSIQHQSAESSPFAPAPLEDRLFNANKAYEEGRLVEAEKLFLNIVFEHASISDAWFKLGNIYYRSGRYPAAINAYETVLKHDIDYEKAWYNLALTRRSQSIETLDMALRHMDEGSAFFRKSVSLRKRLSEGCNDIEKNKLKNSSIPNEAIQSLLKDNEQPKNSIKTQLN